MLSIFRHFFTLGWVSFGGPAAHIGYFKTTFVDRLKWLSNEEYAQLVALSQMLPGPGSSQVGFALGYRQGGLGGAITAFIAFTLPSVILMLIAASVSAQFVEQAWLQGIIAGLKLLAVVVVADAIWGMAKQFCQRAITIVIALLSTIIMLVMSGLLSQLLVLALGAILGLLFLQQSNLMQKTQTHFNAPTAKARKRQVISWPPLVLFALLILGLPMAFAYWPQLNTLAISQHFYQAGSLVFGGGHVVLPLLEQSVGATLGQDTFLTGYALAQAVPGPMFTLATYLGYFLMPSAPILGALLATLMVFLPGFLLVLTVINQWQNLAAKPALRGVLMGINAAVVGLLASAFYQPIATSAIHHWSDAIFALLGFVLLYRFRPPIGLMVAGFALLGFLCSGL
ncbi:chromate efflux transporter [Vibrio stylophorae]|uniref:chromate efflux transporter n=1 Tax=Vibrio stylophorae TaxID=659351 RepID=UPI001EFF7BD8|nr:chromate efflux transporter [Vibrio stylophorae]